MSRKKRVLQALGLEDEFNELFGVKPKVRAPRAPSELPSENPFAVALESAARAPRRRQKPVVRYRRPDPEDADPVKWLERARAEAAERYGAYDRLPGKLTASVKGRVELDPRKLEGIPGAMGERRVPGDEKYDRLLASVEEKGFDPNTHIWLGINHLGEPYIAEGNTRLAVARDLGIERIPAEVMWYGGGELAEGPMMPDLLEKYMPPSELALDPNFRRWFEGSQAVDEYGEPLMMYHGTLSPSPITEFQPNTHFGNASHANERISALSALEDAYRHRYFHPRKAFEAPQVMPVYLNVRNPMRLTDNMDESWRDQIRRAKERGHDSIVYLNRGEMTEDQLAKTNALERTWRGRLSDEYLRSEVPGVGDSYIVFEPTQIKSATGNRGTYDPNDPDIRKARGGFAVKRKKK